MTDITDVGPGIYKTTHPDVIAAYHAAGAARTEWSAKIKAQIAAWGFPDDTQMFVYTGGAFGDGDRLAGLVPPDRVERPGWRFDKKRYFVPARSTKPGKVIAKEFDALGMEPNLRLALKEFGMPKSTFWGFTVGTYGAVLIEDTIWVRWSHPVEGVDPTIWEHVPASQYYALVESGADPFAVADVAAEV